MNRSISSEKSKPPASDGATDKGVPTNSLSASASKIVSKQARFVAPTEGSLTDIVDQAQKHQLGAYDALKAAGYIKPISEFMPSLGQE